MSDLSVGQLVADKYRVDAVLGAGGMGVVVAATHLELGRRVALKFLREDDPESITRFQREARLIGRLKSAHVARVFDVGTFEDKHFIVMELLEGKDFSGVLERAGGTLPVDQAVDYVLEACDAIAEAHAHGVVHRDLKPANLFLTEGRGGSVVKVLDFGISKSLVKMTIEGTTGGLTDAGMAIGSPGYMSPEQMTGALDVDVRTDIFSLGAVLYRLTGGRPPYTGDSLVSILAAMVSSRPTVLGELVPGIPDAFDAVVTRCLARFPNDRYPNVAELAEALVPFGARRPQAAAARIAATLAIGRTRPARPSGSLAVEDLPSSPAPSVVVKATAPLLVTTPLPTPAPVPLPAPSLDESNAPAAREVSPPARVSSPRLSARARSVTGAVVAAIALVGGVLWLGRRAASPPGATDALETATPNAGLAAAPGPVAPTPPPPATILGASPLPPDPAPIADAGETRAPPRHAPPRHRPPVATPSVGAAPSPNAIPGDRH